uniref:Uncharacterized protein n=1 Tax=Arundo donax TaxID=35708 RepID=A0A0A9F4N9_ARUDO
MAKPEQLILSKTYLTRWHILFLLPTPSMQSLYVVG